MRKKFIRKKKLVASARAASWAANSKVAGNVRGFHSIIHEWEAALSFNGSMQDLCRAESKILHRSKIEIEILVNLIHFSHTQYLKKKATQI